MTDKEYQEEKETLDRIEQVLGNYAGMGTTSADYAYLERMRRELEEKRNENETFKGRPDCTNMGHLSKTG